MHYNGQQSCYPLQEGGVGAGVVLTGRLSVPLCSYKHEMKPRGRELAQSPWKCQREVWAWVAFDPGSSMLGTGAPVPANVCQGQQGNQIGQAVLSDTLPCQQRGSLSPFRLNLLSVWFRGERTKTRMSNSQTIGWSYFQSMQ